MMTKTKTKTKTKTMTKCRKDYTCGIFLKSRGCKDIKYDILSASPEYHTKRETKTTPCLYAEFAHFTMSC